MELKTNSTAEDSRSRKHHTYFPLKFLALKITYDAYDMMNLLYGSPAVQVTDIRGGKISDCPYLGV